MKNMKKLLEDILPFQWVVGVILLLLVVALSAGGWYGYRELTFLSKSVTALEDSLASTTALLQQDILESHNALSEALSKEKQSVTSIKREVDDISGTVTSLEKLSKTDPELLQKYSKVFFLNEHYEPPRLIELPDKHEYFENKHTQIHAQVWPFLEDMLNEANGNGVEIFVFSAYRSFGTQEALKNIYTVVYGEGTANQFSADQGYSEHQLGTTVDLITTGIGGTLTGFEKTEAYEWLLKNAHRYGFALSYPENNTFYEFEPWHWRFVGISLATDLHSTDGHFYGLDQRKIDTYLVSFFD